MEHFNTITKLLGMKDQNITINDIVDCQTHKEIIASLDYDVPNCPACGTKMGKYDFQKASKIPYLDCVSFKCRILLKKRRFRCSNCRKMQVAETSLVKKNHQIPTILNQKIAQKLIEKTSITKIAEELSVSTSTVIRMLNEFQFKTNLNHLPTVMSWDEYSFKKGKMSFIAHDFDNKNIIAILDGRTQAVVRNHFLRYHRKVRERVQFITMDMYSPYYQLAKQLFPHAQIVLDRFPLAFSFFKLGLK